MRLHGTAVHFHEPLCQRQTNTQAAMRLLERPVDLREHLKHVLKLFRRNSNAIVVNFHHRLVPLLFG